MSEPGSKGGRGGRGKSRSGGRGRGRGGNRPRNRRKGGVKSNVDSEHNNSSKLSDEDVMISFMKFLRVDQDEEANAIFAEYSNDRKLFVVKVREYLEKKGTVSDKEDQINVQFRNHNASKSNSPIPTRNRGNGAFDKASEPSIKEATVEYTQNNNAHVSPTGNSNQKQLEEMVSSLNIAGPQPNSLPRTMPLPPGLSVIPQTPPPTPILQKDIRTPSSGPSFSSTIIHNSPAVPSTMIPTAPRIPLPTLPIAPKPVNQNIPSTPAPSQSVQPLPVETPAKVLPKWQPKRLNTRLQDQTGRILSNNISANVEGIPHLSLGPRQELTATWELPLSYLRERTMRKIKEEQEKIADESGNENPSLSQKTPENLTIRDALRTLTVGLFRRGCVENGSSHAIIAKEIVPSADREQQQEEYHFEINQQTGTIWGRVPFFTPRTPGNIVLRLYFEDEPIATLATGQFISVVVTWQDLDQTLRFILSNFKSKRGSTNFSSIHSLAAVLEQYKAPIHHQKSHGMDGAGRAAWGGICESRKIVDSCRDDYFKKKTKLENELENLETIKKELDARENINKSDLEDEEGNREENSEKEDQEMKEWQEKMNTLMGERASNERKWKEIQSAYASVLKGIVRNRDATFLLKPDIVKKLELEYALWCPLVEQFASNPFQYDNDKNINYPYPITDTHLKMCYESRRLMQQEVLGFEVKTNPLMPSSYLEKDGICANLSVAMENFYRENYGKNAELVHRQKTQVRELAEKSVTSCAAFPPNTRVVIFGSSANGFGSPKSDLDMCLQVPPGMISPEQGVEAMSELAKELEKAGMINVDTCRLTARIPVIKFDCRVNIDGNENLVECDISMQNPLACINTALLHSYSTISAELRVLAAIVKHWAKRRNINDPSHHTLSSYGYIIMILHFLTIHTPSPNGGIATIFTHPPPCPMLPNLQWVDHRCLQNLNLSYTEWQQKPSNQYTTMIHPTETSYKVNTSFLRINDKAVHTAVRQRIEIGGTKTPAVGYLLAAFFKYYAFHFNYKKHVVSLNAISRSGLVEREAKAEFDGWKLFGQSLAIEDPFEEFYDVAHVLKSGSFQRTRREFALAYSKIVQKMSSGQTMRSADDLLEYICEEYEEQV